MTKEEKKILKKFLTRENFKVSKNLNLEPESLRSPLSYIQAMNETYTTASLAKSVAQVLGGLGVSAAGIKLVTMAIFDPEPTSKLWLLLAGGVSLVVLGSVSILEAVGQSWDIEIGNRNFKLYRR